MPQIRMLSQTLKAVVTVGNQPLRGGGIVPLDERADVEKIAFRCRRDKVAYQRPD